MEESSCYQVIAALRCVTNFSVMIQKMDRKALTARLYYDTDGIVDEDKKDGNEEMPIEP